MRQAKCKLCGESKPNVAGNTIKMWKHLNEIHEIFQIKENLLSTRIDNQPTISKYARKKINLDERIVRLIVIENEPFQKLSKPTFRRNIFLDIYQNNVPKSLNSFRNIMMNYANKCRDTVRMIIKQLMVKDTYFCVSFDEWTSNAQRRCT